MSGKVLTTRSMSSKDPAQAAAIKEANSQWLPGRAQRNKRDSSNPTVNDKKKIKVVEETAAKGSACVLKEEGTCEEAWEAAPPKHDDKDIVFEVESASSHPFEESSDPVCAGREHTIDRNQIPDPEPRFSFAHLLPPELVAALEEDLERLGLGLSPEAAAELDKQLEVRRAFRDRERRVREMKERKEHDERK